MASVQLPYFAFVQHKPAITLLLSVGIFGCNGGGVNSSNQNPPSNLTYSTATAIYVVDTTIIPNAPSVTGTVTSYSINPSLPEGLSLNSTSGVISGKPTADKLSAYYTITATNGGGSTTAIINITVKYVRPSGLSYSTPVVYAAGTSIVPDSPSVIGTVTSYSVSPTLPAGLSLNDSTGVISGTPTTASPSANYTITATNSGGSTTSGVNITVYNTPPSNLSYTTPVAYVVGTAITDNSPTVIGTVAGYSVNPSLPTGLLLNATTGVITGTSTVTKTAANYTVTAFNSLGSTNTIVNITVNPLSLSYTTPFTYTVGVPISSNAPTINGAVTKYSVSPNLPTGLLLDSTTGVISGTPTVSNPTTNYTVTATNSGNSTTAVVNLTVNNVSPSGLSYATPITYAIGGPITNNTPTVTGIVASYSVAPALPAGLALNATTGIISGTPTADMAAANYTVTAANNGGSTTAVIRITVNWGTVRNSGTTDWLKSVIWTGTQFVIAGGGTNTTTGYYSTILTSPDGVTWTARSSEKNTVMFSITWTGSQLVAIGRNYTASTGTILTSPDGVTWTSRTPPANTGALKSVTWTGNQLVAVGDGGIILTSPDGVTWTSRSSGTTSTLFSVTWTGAQLVAVGSNEVNATAAILTSPNGVTWTVRNSGVNTSLVSVIWSGNQLVAVGSIILPSGIASSILTSPDGVTWTLRSSGTTNTLWSVNWAGSQLVAVGDGGIILTSPDGITWTTRNSGTANKLNSITRMGSQQVAVGDGGTILTLP